jgi:hypothetical protein
MVWARDVISSKMKQYNQNPRRAYSTNELRSSNGAGCPCIAPLCTSSLTGNNKSIGPGSEAPDHAQDMGGPSEDLRANS